MLLIGYICEQCKNDLEKQAVGHATFEFARLLKQLHPDKDCRKQFSQVQEGTSHDGLPDEKQFVDDMARISWECIVPGTTCNTVKVGGAAAFCTVDDTKPVMPAAAPYKIDGVPDFLGDKLDGACGPVGNGFKVKEPTKNTKWGRACSYWSVIHTFGLRADALSLGSQLLVNLAQVLAGGALLCAS